MIQMEDVQPAPSRVIPSSLMARWPHLVESPPSQEEIVSRWDLSARPLVTVICSTYNHEDVLADALRGFLTQRTTFPFEIVIRDDASTDGTQQVIKEFAERYPRIIRAVINEENRRSIGIMPVHDRPGLIAGEYTALCDGDDFWVDPLKLQRQVDHLRRNPQVVLSTGGTIFYEVETETERTTGEVRNELTYPDLPTDYHHTSTYLLRSKQYIEVIDKYLLPAGLYGDTPLRSCIVLYGRIGVIPGILSVYRINQSGVWSRMDQLTREETHVRLFATLVRILPWSRRSRELGNLAWSSRQLVDLRYPRTTKDNKIQRTLRSARVLKLMVKVLMSSGKFRR